MAAWKLADLNDPRVEFENVIPQALAFLRSAGIEREIPLIAAGGIRSCEDIARVQALGAAAAQIGTPFAVTHESDAHIEFKRVLAQARDEDMVEFISVAGLPARAVATPWLKSYLKAEAKLQGVAHVKPRRTFVGLGPGMADCGGSVVHGGGDRVPVRLEAALRPLRVAPVRDRRQHLPFLRGFVACADLKPDPRGYTFVAPPDATNASAKHTSCANPLARNAGTAVSTILTEPQA